jgi:hypothetical protein
MPFPFLPTGAVVAASVLIGAHTVFGLILRAMDRAIVGLRDMAVSTLVSGMRSWGAANPDRPAVGSPRSTTSPWSATGPSRATPGRPSASSSTVEPIPQPELVDLGTRSIEPEAAARR